MANESLTTTPNWKEFSCIPYNDNVAEVLKSLGIFPEDIPPEGKPIEFQQGSYSARWTEGGKDPNDLLIVCKPSDNPVLGYTQSCQLGASKTELESGTARQAVGDLAIKYFGHLPASTSSGRALRQWLTMWDWKPPARALQIVAPAEPMVT